MITFVVGATAVGKSVHAVALARATGGEIVTLDSRQWYRGMDIGTAKPGAAERALVPHHLIDVADPDQTVTLAGALGRIRAATAEIESRGAHAILTGGTGQYVRALREGWMVPEVAPDETYRSSLEDIARVRGGAALHADLVEVDAVAAERIGPANVRRLIRALEVYRATGETITTWQARRTEPLAGDIVGLERERSELDERIAARVQAMLAAGLENEVRNLVERGYGFELPAMTAVGYREWQPLIAGADDLETVRRAIITDTRALVRKQDAWFKRFALGVNWILAGTPAMGDAG